MPLPRSAKPEDVQAWLENSHMLKRTVIRTSVIPARLVVGYRLREGIEEPSGAMETLQRSPKRSRRKEEGREHVVSVVPQPSDPPGCILCSYRQPRQGCDLRGHQPGTEPRNQGDEEANRQTGDKATRYPERKLSQPQSLIPTGNVSQ